MATRCPSATEKLIPLGNGCVSFPFGPCTSTAPSWTFTVTPFGTGIGFLPIRDIFLILEGFRLRASGSGRAEAWSLEPGASSLPNIAKHFSAHAGFDGIAAGHDSARRGQDAGAKSLQHLRHIIAAEIDAAPWTADALNARDQTLAVRPVFQEQAQRLDARCVAGRLVEHLETLDVPLVLQNLRDVGLDSRQGHVHARVLGTDGVANPRQHVSNWICHNSL